MKLQNNKRMMEADLNHDWLKNSLTMIMTMRSDDAKHWDAKKLVELAKSFSLGALGFSAGGITAFYPTKLNFHAMSPSLNGRDLVAETIDALHADGIRAIGRIDPSLGSPEELASHPDRFARTAKGEPIQLHDYYLTCPTGDHYRKFIIEVVAEMVQNYAFDGMWANAAQFSPWGTARCYCENCKSQFSLETGQPFPEEDWEDRAWKEYNEWRYKKIVSWNKLVHETIKSIRPGCAWLPLSQVIESWDHIRKGGWDADLTSAHADGTVLEAQRRYCNLWWPGMESRYAHSLNPNRGAGITISYFYPWWRFTHAPVSENKVWAAQIIANGARPWLHLTGFFSEYFDHRGIEPMQELFKTFKERSDVYEDKKSVAEVALVYSRNSLDYEGGANPDQNYLDCFRGAYNALMQGSIPFNLISDKSINSGSLSKYKAVVMPNYSCISTEAEHQIEEYLKNGGTVVASYRTGFCNEWGEERPKPLMAKWLDLHYTGLTYLNLKAAYAAINQPEHEMLTSFTGTDVIPLAGNVCVFKPAKGIETSLLSLIPPVEAFPNSGMSVPEFNVANDKSEDVPLLFSQKIGHGKLIYFPWEPDRIGFNFGLRDPMTLIINAVMSALKLPDLISVGAEGLVDVSVMGGSNSLVVHLVNFNSSGGGIRSNHRRAVESTISVSDISIDLRLPDDAICTAVEAIRGGVQISFKQEQNRVKFSLPILEEFESILIKLK